MSKNLVIVRSECRYLIISLCFFSYCVSCCKIILGVPKEKICDIIRGMKCERCKNENNQIKAGKTKAGSQKYKCKHCGKVYTPNPKERNYSEEVKKQAIKLYMEGNSGRAVGRILGISKNICLYWIKKYAKKIQPKNRANERVEVIEMDELYSFMERKKQNLHNNTSK